MVFEFIFIIGSKDVSKNLTLSNNLTNLMVTQITQVIEIWNVPLS